MTLLGGFLPYARDRYGITRLGVFGSVARGEQTEDSDVDVCYEGRALSLLTLDMLQCELEELLKCPVDAVRVRDNMNPALLAQIRKEGLYVQWRQAHHYFEVDAEIVLLTLKEVIPLVKSIIDQMTKETE